MHAVHQSLVLDMNRGPPAAPFDTGIDMGAALRLLRDGIVAANLGRLNVFVQPDWGASSGPL